MRTLTLMPRPAKPNSAPPPQLFLVEFKIRSVRFALQHVRPPVAVVVVVVEVVVWGGCFAAPPVGYPLHLHGGGI